MAQPQPECSLAEFFSAQRLERVFARCFAERWCTMLEGGAAEPFYQPALAGENYHRLHYRSDYFASALHEVAHWCIAGKQRRQQPDFGYWYAPDGRNAEQQAAFEAVEYKPQALEWWFSRACGYPFRISVDNLDAAGGEVTDSEAFKQRVFEQVGLFQLIGLPARAAIFSAALAEEFGTGVEADRLEFRLAELQV